MPICKKCSTGFPNRIILNGRQHNLQKRRYCLTCSPFGRHNTRRLNDNTFEATCEHCGRGFSYSRQKGGTRRKCNSCHVNSRRFNIKKRAVEYKGGRCVICSYDKCLACLEFHHVDPTKKSFQIAGAHSRSWARIQEELDKCILLCCRCHTEVENGVTPLPCKTTN